MQLNKNVIILGLIICLVGLVLTILDVNIFNTQSKVWMSVGCSLLASSLVIVLSALLVERINKNEVVDEWGVQKVYTTRLEKNKEADPLLIKAHYCVDGVAFGLSTFRANHQREVETALQNGVNFRLLVMDPDSEFTKQRDREENNQPGHIAKSIKALIAWADQLNKKAYKGKITIKGYRCMTLDFYWRVDDDVFFGPYWYNRPSSGTITYRLSKGKKCADLYAQYFESLWTSAEMKQLTV